MCFNALTDLHDFDSQHFSDGFHHARGFDGFRENLQHLDVVHGVEELSLIQIIGVDVAFVGIFQRLIDGGAASLVRVERDCRLRTDLRIHRAEHWPLRPILSCPPLSRYRAVSFCRWAWKYILS